MPRRRLLLLLLLTTGPAAAEAISLRAVRFRSALPLAPQVTAPTPYGVFHDLRWAFVYHDTWWAFVVELVGVVVLRSVLNAAIIRTVFPDASESTGAPALSADPRLQNFRPSWGRSFRANLIFNVVATGVLSPFVVVAMAASGTSLSSFLYAEVLPVVVLSLVMQRGGIIGSWWRGVPPLAAIGWALATFVIITVDAAVIGSAPGWWAVPVAAIAGAVNAWLWSRMAQAAIARRPVLRWVPVAPLVMVLALVALGAKGASTTPGTSGQSSGPPVIDVPAPDVRQVVIHVDGYDSAYQPPDPPSKVPLVRYSYRGLNADGQPLPYDPLATHQSLAESARLLDEQVRALHRRTGQPIALVAQSEGTLVVRKYLDTVRENPVDAVVLLSPLVRPARIYYPPPHLSGWGVGAGWELRGLFRTVRLISASRANADEPFIRSILDDALLYRDRMLCPVPGKRMIAFLPTASAAVVPPASPPGIHVVELVGVHASLATRPDVQRQIIDFLRGASVGPDPPGYYPLVQRAAAAWQAPALPLTVNPVWHAAGQPDTAFGENGCATT